MNRYEDQEVIDKPACSDGIWASLDRRDLRIRSEFTRRIHDLEKTLFTSMGLMFALCFVLFVLVVFTTCGSARSAELPPDKVFIEVHPAVAPDPELSKLDKALKALKALKSCVVVFKPVLIVGRYGFRKFCAFGEWSDRTGFTKGLQASGALGNTATPFIIPFIK